MAIEIVRQKANDINLDRDLYAKAYDMGVSFSQMLELIDPSESNDKLDAFERQLMRFGIRTKDDPKTGMGASKGEMFFQSNQPASVILFPEYLNRVARVAVMNQDDIMASIVSATEMISDNGIYRSLYIDDTEANRQFRRVAERGEFPVVRISWSEKATTLAKFGVAIQMSYEFVRRASLPLISTLVGRIMLQTRLDEVGMALSALGNGDGSGHASGGKITSTNLTVYQGGTPEGTQDMTYAGWLKWLYVFYPGMCTTVFGCVDDTIDVMTIGKPTVDPLWLYSFLDKSQLGGVPTLLNGRLSASVSHVIHDQMTANTLIGIDKAAALIAYREAGTDLTETNKIINGQWNEIVMSNTIGFQTLFASARKELISVHDQAQQGTY